MKQHVHLRIDFQASLRVDSTKYETYSRRSAPFFLSIKRNWYLDAFRRFMDYSVVILLIWAPIFEWFDLSSLNDHVDSYSCFDSETYNGVPSPMKYQLSSLNKALKHG